MVTLKAQKTMQRAPALLVALFLIAHGANGAEAIVGRASVIVRDLSAIRLTAYYISRKNFRVTQHIVLLSA